MNDLCKDYINTLNPDTIAAAMVLLFLLCWYLVKNHKLIADFFNNIYSKRKDLDSLIDAQKDLSISISALALKIDEMQRNTDARFKESEQKNNKRIRAELKDKISRSYRYYHSIGKINDMELEALEDLIDEYESAEGSNSFVHTIVQKEMYTWERIGGK